MRSLGVVGSGMAKRPSPCGISGVRARPIRGPDDTGRWYWRVERHDTRVTVWTGWGSRADIEAVVAQEVAAPRPKQAAAAPIRIRTLRDLLGAWVASIEDAPGDRSERTVVAYRATAKRVARVAGDMILARLQVADVLEASRKGGSAPRTRQLEQVVLRMAWSWARPIGVVPDRTLAHQTVTIPKEVKRVPTPDELDAIVRNAAPGWPRVAIRMLAVSGMRVGELASLTWDRIRRHEQLVEVRGKSGARLVPIPGDILDELDGLPRARTQVLGYHPVSGASMVRHALAAAAISAGVEHVTPHAIRRAAADTLLRGGVDVGTAAALLGHSPEVLVKFYRQATLDDVRRAAARLGRVGTGDVIDLELALRGRRV